MMAKESVKRRLEGEDGISFTEFSYQLLQAYDYLVLHDRDRCTLQMGGSDQWGNITAGCDLIRKVRARARPRPGVAADDDIERHEVREDRGRHDLARSALTSPFRFYQFWLNTDDRDVVKYLKFFTWLDQAMIAELERLVASGAREARSAAHARARSHDAWCTVRTAWRRPNSETAALFGGGE